MRFKKGQGHDDLDGALVHMIEDAERRVAHEFIINSGLRSSKTSSHGEGLAVDLKCKHSWLRWLYVRALTDAGFCRIGIYDQHIHVDIAVDRPQNVLWIGVSK